MAEKPEYEVSADNLAFFQKLIDASQKAYEVESQLIGLSYEALNKVKMTVKPTNKVDFAVKILDIYNSIKKIDSLQDKMDKIEEQKQSLEEQLLEDYVPVAISSLCKSMDDEGTDDTIEESKVEETKTEAKEAKEVKKN